MRTDERNSLHDEVVGLSNEVLRKLTRKRRVNTDVDSNLVATYTTYVRFLLDAAAAGHGLTPEAERALHAVGVRAAREGADLADVVRVCSAGITAVGGKLSSIASSSDGGRRLYGVDVSYLTAMMCETADAAMNAVVSGHSAQRREGCTSVVEERSAFLARLVTGTGDLMQLVEEAEVMGFHAAANHVVFLVDPCRRIQPASRALAWVEASLQTKSGDDDLMVAAHGDHLVVVAGVDHEGADRVAEMLPHVLGHALGEDPVWHAGVGRPRRGLRGVQLSYQDAHDALALWDPTSGKRVVGTDELLLARVLGRDRCAMADLIRSVLGPLTAAQNGAEPLLDTLDEYFRACCVTTEAAKALYLSVRAVSYRLRRIKDLTGHDVDCPRDRLALQVALAGARHFGWPGEELPDLD